jgi:hypothetical protein
MIPPNRQKVKPKISTDESVPLKPSDTFEDSVALLNKLYPGKILFTFKEAAEILIVGPDFIRRRCSNGKISFKQIGDKRMIHVLELARILFEGVD